MDLASCLAIVKRATSDNALVVALKYIHVYDGRMQSSDGSIVIDAACPELDGMTFSVPGSKFVKAVDACKGNPDKIDVSESSVTIKQGKFKAKLPILEGLFPRREFSFKDDAWFDVPDNFISTLKSVIPFVGEDASRPWCCGVLLKNKKAFATNNTTVIETDLDFGTDSLEVNIPAFAIREMINFNRPPKRCHIEAGAVTFDYGDFLFKTQLLSSTWPDLSKLLNAISSDIPEIPSDLKSAVEKVVDFCPDAEFQCIVFDGTNVSTTEGATHAEISGFELPEGKYRAVVLQKVLDHATYADFSCYPNPIPFKTDDGLRGVFVGVRQ